MSEVDIIVAENRCTNINYVFVNLQQFKFLEYASITFIINICRQLECVYGVKEAD